MNGSEKLLLDKKVDEGLVLLGQPKVLLFHEAQHRAFRQLVELPLADETLLAGVDAKEQVEHDAHDGYEPDDQCPRHRLRRLAVVHHDVDHRQHDDDIVEDDEYQVQTVHLFDVYEFMCLQGQAPLGMRLDIVDTPIYYICVTCGIARVAGLEVK